MRKTVLLNSMVSNVISEMGHTDMLTVGDCGLPIPEYVERIDLALKLGVPSFLETLDTILEELCVERIILAEEIKTASPEMEKAVLSRFGDKVKVEYVPQLVEMGLNGIEVSHPHLFGDTARQALRAAEQYGLYRSGGTDHTGAMSGSYGRNAVPATEGITEEEYLTIKERRLD